MRLLYCCVIVCSVVLSVSISVVCLHSGGVFNDISMRKRLGWRPSTETTSVRRVVYSLCVAIIKSSSSDSCIGSISAIIPLSESIGIACSMSCFRGRLSLWRAAFLFSSGLFSELLKYGGLETIRSYFLSVSYSVNDLCMTFILLRKGDLFMFSVACSHASLSMSIASAMTLLLRCAIIIAISPVPVPMSRTWNFVSGVCVSSLVV